MSHSPFELLPVELLYPEKGRASSVESGARPRMEPEKAMTRTNDAVPRMLRDAKRRDLSEKSGLALLQLVKTKSGGQVVFSRAKPVPAPQRQPQKHHRDTFYLPAMGAREPQPEEFDAKAKLVQGVGIVVSPVNIPYIDLDFLVRHRVTLHDILTVAQVDVDELCHAHILRTLKDLMALDFRLDDLVVRRDDLFNTTKLVANFGVTYATMLASPQFRKRATVVDLLRCQFYPNELKQMEFTFDHMIENGFVTKTQLAAFRFDLEGMRLCGFTPAHVDTMRLKERDVLHRFKWDWTDFCDFYGVDDDDSSSDSGVITDESSDEAPQRRAKPKK